MNHTTSIGLDVHARSIAAAALDPLTGEVVTKTFAYSPGKVASWALGFDSPKAVYESGVTGFHLCRELEKFIRAHAREPRWRGRVDDLRCLKGIEEITAFALVAEAGVFSRFDSARAFSTWAGLVPSEHSSGPRRRTGGITKTGNSNVRRLLVEASWHYARATAARKPAPSPDVPLRIENHAAKAVKRLVARRREMSARGKRPSVANCATARELACRCWAIGRMAEGADA